MKKFLIFLIVLFSFMSVSAVGSVTVSKNNISLEKGQSTSFTINASNVAGVVDIVSSDTNVVTVDKSKHFFDTTLDDNPVTITVTAINNGSAVITISLTDIATFDNEELTGTRTIEVIVNSNNGEEPGNNDEPNNNGTEPGNNDEPNNNGTEPGNNDEPNNNGTESGNNDEPNNNGTEPGNNDEPNNNGTEPGNNDEPNNNGTEPGNYQYEPDKTKNEENIVNNVPKTDFNIKGVVIFFAVLLMLLGIGIVYFVNKKRSIGK